MKVILQQDVARLGRRHEEVEVSNGYALNRLIPAGLAVAADTASRRYVQQRTKQASDQMVADEQLLDTCAAAFGGDTPLLVTLAANEQGHLFQAVNAEAVVAAAQQAKVPLTTQLVVLPAEPIKHVGTHTITLQAGERTAEITIEVTAIA